jgi:hypothetical protein
MGDRFSGSLAVHCGSLNRPQGRWFTGSLTLKSEPVNRLLTGDTGGEVTRAERQVNRPFAGTEPAVVHSGTSTAQAVADGNTPRGGSAVPTGSHRFVFTPSSYPVRTPYGPRLPRLARGFTQVVRDRSQAVSDRSPTSQQISFARRCDARSHVAARCPAGCPAAHRSTPAFVLYTRPSTVVGRQPRAGTESATSGIVGAGNPIDEIAPPSCGQAPRERSGLEHTNWTDSIFGQDEPQHTELEP